MKGSACKFRPLAASNFSLSAKFDYSPCVSRAFGVSLCYGGVEAVRIKISQSHYFRYNTGNAELPHEILFSEAFYEIFRQDSSRRGGAGAGDVF